MILTILFFILGNFDFMRILKQYLSDTEVAIYMLIHFLFCLAVGSDFVIGILTFWESAPFLKRVSFAYGK